MSNGLGFTQTQKFGRVVSPVVCADLRLLRMLAQLAIGVEGAIGFEGLARPARFFHQRKRPVRKHDGSVASTLGGQVRDSL